MAADSTNKEIIVKLTIEEARFLKQAAEAKSALEGLDKRTREYKNGISELVSAQTRLATTRKKLTVERRTATAELVNATKATKQLKDATGGTTSAALELGRVVQDAPYGIRGMANNITQLVSSMAFATKQAGSLKLALAQLWKTLMGPLGIVLAISAVVAALDHFYGGQKKSTEATDNQTKAIKRQITPLEKLVTLYNSLRKVLLSDSDSTAIRSYKNNMLSLDETVKVLTRNFSEFKNAYDKLSEKQKKDPNSVKALVDGYAELLSLREKEKTQVKKLLELRKNVDKYGRTSTSNGLTTIRIEAQQLDVLESQYVATQKRLIKLDEYFKKSNESTKEKKTKSKLLPEPKEFEKEAKDLQSVLNRFNRDEKLALAKTEEEKLIIKEKYALIDLELRQKNNKEAYLTQAHASEKLLDLYLKQQVKLGKMTQKDADKEMADFWKPINESIDDSDKVYKKARTAIEKLYTNLRKAERDAQAQGEEKGGTEKVSFWTKRLEEVKVYASAVKDIIGGLNDFVQAELDRELTIEQNKTTAKNNELNQRLLNEGLSKDERKAIQNEIAQNDEALRVKQEAIERKKFEANKKARIAQGLVDTYSAAVGVLADAKGGFWSRLAQVVPTIALGLANVANIARQRFQTSGSSVSRGAVQSSSSSNADDGDGDRRFNFNLVGNNPENQLASLIQSKFDTPIKAFVVSKDMTTQQQLDANIRSTATV